MSKNLEALAQTLKYFWEIEHVENLQPGISDQLKFCNQHFDDTHFRKSDGRGLLEKSFKPEFYETILGDSKKIDSKRLNYLWQRRERNHAMKNLYTEFSNGSAIFKSHA